MPGPRQRALVRNAADPQQVKRAGQKERDARTRWLAVIRKVLDTAEGRFVLSQLLINAGLDASVYDVSGSNMYFREGRRNFGLELKADIIDADERLFELMEREQRQRTRLDETTNEALGTARADDEETTEE